MVLVAFNKKFINKETNKVVQASESIEMTVKRADEIVKSIRGTRKDYEDFGYERVEVSADKENTKKEDDSEKVEKETDTKPPVKK